MCGRYTLKNNKAVKAKYNIDVIPSYNIAPSQKILIFNGDSLEYIRWSFSPKWAKIPMNLTNARKESLNIKPSFKNCKRCVIIADGWFEWQRIRDNKIPFYHYLNYGIFYMAGIYNDNGCAIVTKKASQNIQHIHHRQPFLLSDLSILDWIKLNELINSCVSKKIQYHPVSKFVNLPSNNNIKCIENI